MGCWVKWLLVCVAALEISGCIIREDCLYTPKEGHPWRATVVGTAIHGDQPAIPEGGASECFSDEENAALLANDPMDPVNAALRNQLYAAAQADCTANASQANYSHIKCDPFAEEFDGIAQIALLDGTCPQSVENGLKGTPIKKGASCPDKPAGSASAGDSATGGGGEAQGSVPQPL